MVQKNQKKKSKQRAIKGKGAYSMPPWATRFAQMGLEKSFPSPAKTGTWQNTAARTLGGALGSTFGPVGSALGGAAGGALSRWLGYGKYTLSSNSLIVKPKVPMMHSNDQSTIIRHREYLQDIITSSSASTFQAQTFTLNPGLAATFPWLSNIAQAYQEYTIKGCIFEFVSTSANALNSTNTALGTVSMATQYRANAAAFTNKAGMNNEYFSSDGKPSEDIIHPIECDPKENPLNIQYVRGTSVPSGEDPKTYDLGTFTIATSGFQGTSVNIGELWVSYEIQLRKPAVAEFLGNFLGTAHYTHNTATNALPFSGHTLVFDNFGLTIASNGTITFPRGFLPGTYMFNATWFGTSAVCTAPLVTGTNGITLPTNLLGNSTNSVPGTATETTTTLTVWGTFIYTPDGTATQPTLKFGVAGTLPTTVTLGDLVMTQISTLFV